MQWLQDDWAPCKTSIKLTYFFSTILQWLVGAFITYPSIVHNIIT